MQGKTVQKWMKLRLIAKLVKHFIPKEFAFWQRKQIFSPSSIEVKRIMDVIAGKIE